jgi:monoamine oxidase
MEKTIVIVGAGAAGLIAARELLQAGYKVIITEADKRLGGRIHTKSQDTFNPYIEGGAEFIHGKLPITLNLLKEANIAYERVEGEMWQVREGEWNQQWEMAPGWKEMIEKMMDLKEDMTIAGFLQKYFPGEKYAALRQSAARFAEGFDVADTTKASVMAVREEWSDDMEDTFRVLGGYGQLVDYLTNQILASGCELFTACRIQKISWQKDTVRLIAEDGRVVEGNKVIVTVPVGVLQSGSIQFEPAIEKYMQAAHQIGYGSVIKVFFQFKEIFWDEKDIGFILSDEIIPTWWTQSPEPRPQLVGWLGGEQVNRVGKASHEEIIALAIQSLCNIFKIDKGALRQMIVAQEVQNWSDHPFALGAYSYSTLQTTAARQLFREPIDNTIYFAGEGYNEGESSATVEAALQSGLKTAKLIV